MNITTLICIALGLVVGILFTIVLVLKDENMHQSIVIRQQDEIIALYKERNKSFEKQLNEFEKDLNSIIGDLNE